jgi:hypothetical protein
MALKPNRILATVLQDIVVRIVNSIPTMFPIVFWSAKMRENARWVSNHTIKLNLMIFGRSMTEIFSIASALMAFMVPRVRPPVRPVEMTTVLTERRVWKPSMALVYQPLPVIVDRRLPMKNRMADNTVKRHRRPSVPRKPMQMDTSFVPTEEPARRTRKTKNNSKVSHGIVRTSIFLISIFAFFFSDTKVAIVSSVSMAQFANLKILKKQHHATWNAKMKENAVKERRTMS